MKNAIYVFTLFLLSFSLAAQQTPAQKEVGLMFNSLDNFGLTYRIGNQKALWRFNTVLISGGTEETAGDSTWSTTNELGFNLRAGREYRKEIVEHLELRYGADVSFGYSQSSSETDDESYRNSDRSFESFTYESGVNLVIGFNYLISEHFMIGAELLPGFTYATGERASSQSNSALGEEKSEFANYTYGLSNNSAWLSLAFKF